MSHTQYYTELAATAKAIVANGKGILAADESTGTIGARFKAINVENNLENRVEYRRILFSTPKLNESIGGAILFEETLLNPELADLLKVQNILIGIKVDKGTAALPFGETTTTGLDGLLERCQGYYKLGARFAKWRCVLKIGAGCFFF